jgi:hypothetical protein
MILPCASLHLHKASRVHMTKTQKRAYVNPSHLLSVKEQSTLWLLKATSFRGWKGEELSAVKKKSVGSSFRRQEELLSDPQVQVMFPK